MLLLLLSLYFLARYEAENARFMKKYLLQNPQLMKNFKRQKKTDQVKKKTEQTTSV